jgi:hypothetical protein
MPWSRYGNINEDEWWGCATLNSDFDVHAHDSGISSGRRFRCPVSSPSDSESFLGLPQSPRPSRDVCETMLCPQPHPGFRAKAWLFTDFTQMVFRSWLPQIVTLTICHFTFAEWQKSVNIKVHTCFVIGRQGAHQACI